MADYTNSTISVSTTATWLAAVGFGNAVLVHNLGPQVIFLGGSTVTADETSTGGLQVYPGEKVTVPIGGSTSATLYGSTATGSSTVGCLLG